MTTHDPSSHPPTVYLKPGEFYIGEKPAKVVTVLGSCVSVTLFNKKLHIGAICHAALPLCRKKEGCRKYCDDTFKYTDCSIKFMLKKFRDFGVAENEIEVKIFGGADTLASRSENTIGTMNVRIALDTIREKNLHIIAADVGDSFGRKLIFHTDTGDVFLKRLRNARPNRGIPGVTFKKRGI
jgi:chemotaxis protein CheD